MSDRSFITRAEAEVLREDYLVPTTRWKPAIWGFSKDGGRYLVKDASACSWLFRHTIGALSLTRELRIYRKLAGLSFVPACQGRLGRHALIFERVAGHPLRGLKKGEIQAEFFAAVECCIAKMHDRGVVHLDLGHRSNIMISPAGAPIFLDFEAALYLGKSRLSRMLLHPIFSWADHSALTKYRLRYVPQVVEGDQTRRFRRLRAWRRIWPSWRIWPLPGFRHKKGSGRQRAGGSADQR